MHHTYQVYVAVAHLVEPLINYLYLKKVRFKLLEKNNKSDPPYVIIKTSRSKRDLDKLIRSKFKNNFTLRC